MISIENPGIVRGIECVVAALELVGVAVIAVAFAYAMVHSLWRFWRRRPDAYELLRKYLGRSLLLGLEFLVAADIIRTVLIEPTEGNVMSLGLLVVVRIVLGWSIAVEIEGCWPWQMKGRPKVERDQ